MENQNDHPPAPDQEDADWPYASLLLFGFFGTGTAAGRRLVWRSSAALLLFIVATLALGDVFPQPLPDALWIIAIPASVLAIAWANSRYLKSLDELSRMIQLQGFAIAYGAAMVVGFTFAAIAMATPTGTGGVGAELLLLFVLVEPLRAFALAILASRYR